MANIVRDIAVIEEPIDSRRRLRMVCIGAGFAGIFLAHKHKYGGSDSFIDLKIYEKNAGLGGTWFENKYPGVACDVPAHIYCFPWAPNPDWSRFYVSGEENLEYMNKVVDQFGLRHYIQCDSRIVSAIWSEDQGKWLVKIQHGEDTILEEADILVNGSGILNRWRWPDIPDSATDAARGGKYRFAYPYSHLDHTELPGRVHTRREEFEYTEDQKRNWRENPEALRDHRRELEHVFNNYFQVFLKDSPAQGAVREMFGNIMKQKLGNDAGLIEKLMPEWPVGCRRITPGDGYLEALQADNVRINTNPIVEIVAKGVVTSPQADTGVERELNEVDILVCATGFDVSFRPAFELRGLGGVLLSDLWQHEAEAYLGICAPACPNYFIYNGPNCPIGHGSLMACMDVATEYIYHWADKIAKQNIKSVVVKPEVVREYNDYSQAFLQRTVWASNCRSWYKGHRAEGRVSAMYAGSTIHYRELLKNFRGEDFDYTFLTPENRFTFMGNGITKLEAAGGNLGFYLDM